MARYARRPSGTRRPRGPWKHGPIPVLGLVGGIGAGKSAAAAELVKLGAQLLDADAIGHALLEQRPGFEAVVERFGSQILGPDGVIDRRRLGAIVFQEPRARRDLEEILHPKMRRTFERAIARAARKGEVEAVVLDAAILFEAGWDDLCDRIAFVDAPADVRRARLVEHRGWDATTINAREQAQLSEDVKRQRAGLVLRNDAGPDELREAVAALWARIVGPASGTRAAAARPGPRPSGSAAPSPARPRTDPPPALQLPGSRLDEEI